VRAPPAKERSRSAAHDGRTARRRLVRLQRLVRAAGRLGPRAHSAQARRAPHLGLRLRVRVRVQPKAWPRSAALRREQRFLARLLPEAALARAVDLPVQHPAQERHLALRREQRALPGAQQVLFWRRSAACPGLPEGVPARAREAVPRAPHWARPAALARLAQGPLRAARGAPGPRQEAEHAAAGRPAAPGAVEVRPRAGRPAWAQPGAAPWEARGAEARGVRPAVRPGAEHAAAGRPAVLLWAVPAGLPWAVRPSAAASVFRQGRVRLVELVRRRSERFARATACLRSAAPSMPSRQAARDEGVSYVVSPPERF